MTRLEVDQLSKAYPTRAEPLEVLRDVSLSVAPGESVAILGPSGSGKSTLLAILGALERPTGGAIDVQGSNPFSLDEASLAHYRNRSIGLIFQEHYLLPQLTAIENVLVPALAEGSVTPELSKQARELLDRVGLGHRVDHRPAELSGGERQRVAIARALLRKPALVLADEPTGSLDRASAQSVGELLTGMTRELGTMLVVATHSAELAAMLDRRYEIVGGRLSPIA